MKTQASIHRDVREPGRGRQGAPALRISQELAGEIERHLRAALPSEGCGLLGGTAAPGGPITANRFFPGSNVDAVPTRYTMEPSEVARALETLEQEGILLVAIVHSHPDGPATPSRTDLAEFHYPGALMLIADLSSPMASFRAWRIDPILRRPEEWPVNMLDPQPKSS